MEPDLGLLLGVVGMALLFALTGLIPLAHRPCDDCTGDCTSCDLESPRTGPLP